MKDLPLTEAAKRCALPYRSLQDYAAGKRSPGVEAVAKLADGLEINARWLVNGEGEMLLTAEQAARQKEMHDEVIRGRPSAKKARDARMREMPVLIRDKEIEFAASANLVMVPHLGIEAGAGAGRYAVKTDRNGDLAFRLDWLQKRGINPKQAGLVTVRGDSMLEKLHDGDVVLVDQGDKEQIRSGLCYVLRQGDEIIVKYLSRLPNGRIQATSENSSAFPPFLIELGVHIEIIGRVRADAHEWD